MDPDSLMRSSGLSFFRSSKAGRMTANNFFKNSPNHFDSDNSSVSSLISNTREVLAGSLSILRKKQVKHSGYGPVTLSNDIGSLIKEFH
jgi:hypothetical protein